MRGSFDSTTELFEVSGLHKVTMVSVEIINLIVHLGINKIGWEYKGDRAGQLSPAFVIVAYDEVVILRGLHKADDPEDSQNNGKNKVAQHCAPESGGNEDVLDLLVLNFLPALQLIYLGQECWYYAAEKSISS